MKLLIIRHGEPDYAHDCLTDNGRLQAELLAKRLAGVKIDAAYHSPMGRAAETAQIALSGRDIPLSCCGWLHEYDVKVRERSLPDPVEVWDVLPSNWTADPLCFDRERFAESGIFSGSDAHARFIAAAEGLDAVLASHGLIREGGVYRKESACDETLAFFCHFGMTCVMSAHLLGVSPMITLQGMSAEPTAIATFCTDDRFGDLVNFRMHGFGDISHLPGHLGGGVNYR